MKKSFAALFLLIGVLSVILAFVAYGSDVGYYEYSEAYGGDAYTGIQNAAAQTANNVKYLAEAITFSSGSILLVTGLVLIAYGLSKITSTNSTDNTVSNSYQITQPIAQPGEHIITEQPTTHTTINNDPWICKHCNTENSINYGQCKKCGTFRSC